MRIFIQIAAVVIVIGTMTICMVEDLRGKQIHVVNLVAFVLANILMAWCNQNSWEMTAAGSTLGMLFWVISICTEEKIGRGDAVFIGGMGINLGFWSALTVVFLSLILVCLYGLIFVKKRKGWSYEIAFVPFMLVPYASAVIYQLYTACLVV